MYVVRIYKSLSNEQKEHMRKVAERRVRRKYPVGTRLRKLVVTGHRRVETVVSNETRFHWEIECTCDCGRTTCVKPSTVSGRGKCVSCGCEGRLARTKASQSVWTLPPGEAAARTVFYQQRASALSRGIDFNLSLEDFKTIVSKKCHYCGAPPNKAYAPYKSGKLRLNGPFIYNGIDRTDSTKPYTVENCVPCCKDCNYAKHRMSLDEFKNWLRRVASHLLGMQ